MFRRDSNEFMREASKKINHYWLQFMKKWNGFWGPKSWITTQTRYTREIMLQVGITIFGSILYLQQLVGGAYPKDTDFIRSHLGYIIGCMFTSVVCFAVVLLSISISHISLFARLRRFMLTIFVLMLLFYYDQGIDCQTHGQFSMFVFLLALLPIYFLTYFFNALFFHFWERRKFIGVCLGFLFVCLLWMTIKSIHYMHIYPYGLFNKAAINSVDGVPLRSLYSGIPFYDLLPLSPLVSLIDSKCTTPRPTFKVKIVDRTLTISDCNEEISFIPIVDTKSWSRDQKKNFGKSVHASLLKIKYTQPVYLPENCESVIIQCGLQKILELAVSPKVPKTPMRLKKVKNGKKNLNTLIIFIDAVSRRQFFRKLPLTAAVLESLHRPPVQTVNQFFRFALTGFNTNPNTQALYTGYQDDNEDLAYERTYRDHPPVWKSFADNGFITSWMTDDCDDYSRTYLHNTTSYLLTHEFNAPFCHPDYFPEIDPLGNFKGPYSIKSRCLYGDYVHNLGFRWIDTMRNMYRNASAPWFMVNSFTEAHEGTAEIVTTMDEDLANLLKRMNADGELENTALFLLSDHGNHMSPHFLLTENGKIEQASPFLFTVFPESVTKLPGVVDALNWNEQMVVTAYDLHETFEALARFNTDDSQFHNFFKNSLFHKFSATRTCNETKVYRKGVPDNFCIN